MIDQKTDWRGEHLISAKPKSRSQRLSINASASVGMAMERRRQSGNGVSQSQETWAKQFRGYWKCGGPAR